MGFCVDVPFLGGIRNFLTENKNIRERLQFFWEIVSCLELGERIVF